MLTTTYTYVRYNIYQTVYKQTDAHVHMIKQKGNTVLGYLAKKQHFVPFHPIKALDRQKQAVLSLEPAICQEAWHLLYATKSAIKAKHASKDAMLKQELKKVAKAT